MSEAWRFEPWPAGGSAEVQARGPGGLHAVVTFAAWPDHVAIQEIHWRSEQMDDASLLDGILAACVKPPHRITHALASRWPIVAWYQRSAWADCAVVSGTIGVAGHYYDPVLGLSPPEDGSELGASILVDADFRPVLAPEVSFETLRELLLQATWLTRVVALRRAARASHLSADEVAELHWLALTDDASAVRQFTSVQVSCLFADQSWKPTLNAVRAALAEPLAALDRWGPRPELTGDRRVYRRDHARHSVRVAWLWIVGNLAWMSDGYHAPGLEIMRAVGDGLREDVVAAAHAWTAEADVALSALVAQDVASDGLGLGVREQMTLFEIARFVVLRSQRVPPEEEDRTAWLIRSVEALMPPGAETDATRVLYASGP